MYDAIVEGGVRRAMTKDSFTSMTRTSWGLGAEIFAHSAAKHPGLELSQDLAFDLFSLVTPACTAHGGGEHTSATEEKKHCQLSMYANDEGQFGVRQTDSCRNPACSLQCHRHASINLLVEA
jgi:hypothetical protein